MARRAGATGAHRHHGWHRAGAGARRDAADRVDEPADTLTTSPPIRAPSLCLKGEEFVTLLQVRKEQGAGACVVAVRGPKQRVRELTPTDHRRVAVAPRQ